MMQPRLVIKPSSTTTRLLLTANEDLLRARLPPPRHPHAAAALLLGLSRWLQQPLSVVLCAGEEASSSALNLYDDFGFGVETAHYQVEVVEPSHRRRGLGSFHDLRQLVLRGVR
jgi:GNAT superfamily N-acetyltransferase